MIDPEHNIANIFGVLFPAMEKILIESWKDFLPWPIFRSACATHYMDEAFFH